MSRKTIVSGRVGMLALGLACGALLFITTGCAPVPSAERVGPTPSASASPTSAPVRCADDEGTEQAEPVDPLPTAAPEVDLLPQLPMDSEQKRWTWGPDRPKFTYCHPAGAPVINSIVDDSHDIDETAFYFFRAPGSETQLRNVDLHAGDTFAATVYFWNDVAENITEGATTNARISLDFPQSVTSNAQSRAEICADNTIPRCVWMTLALRTQENETLQLKVREDSAVMQVGGQSHPVDWERLVSAEGLPVGCDGFDGVLDGTNACKGAIVFEVEVGAPDAELSVSTSTSSYDKRIRPGSQVRTTVTYSNPADEGGTEPLYLGVISSPGFEHGSDKVEISTWDAESMAWSKWEVLTGKISEPSGLRWIIVPDRYRSAERISIAVALTASTSEDFECGGRWAEVRGYASYDGVVQMVPTTLTIDAIC